MPSELMEVAELSSDELAPRANAGEIEQRGAAMLLDKLAGRRDEDIALRYGVSPDLVADLVRDAVDSAIAKREHRIVQTALLLRLVEMDRELAELNDQLPLIQTLNYEVVDTRQGVTDENKVVRLSKEENNAANKIKIFSERRQNALATKTILSADTGEKPAINSNSEMAEIVTAITAATKEVAERAMTEARTVGRMEQALKDATSINISAVEVDNEQSTNGFQPPKSDK